MLLQSCPSDFKIQSSSLKKYVFNKCSRAYNLHTSVQNHKIMLNTEYLKRTGLIGVPKVTGHNRNALLQQTNTAMSAS